MATYIVPFIVVRWSDCNLSVVSASALLWDHDAGFYHVVALLHERQNPALLAQREV